MNCDTENLILHRYVYILVACSKHSQHTNPSVFQLCLGYAEEVLYKLQLCGGCGAQETHFRVAVLSIPGVENRSPH